MNILEATAAVAALLVLFAIDTILELPDVVMDLIAFGF
jgi:hypothetical protein